MSLLNESSVSVEIIKERSSLLQASNKSFQFATALNNYIRFSDTDITIIKEVAIIRRFKKGDIILRYSQNEEYISCIAKGLVGKYLLHNNEPIFTSFAKEGDVVCSNASFGSRLPSEYCVIAIEDSILISFTLDSLHWLYVQSPVFFEFGKVIVAMSLLQFEEREIMLSKYDAKEKVNYFIKSKPDLFNRLPQNYIASFLAIQPQTFSRLKALV